MKATMIISAICSLAGMCVGVLLLLWAIVCLFGGPDGKIGSPESFMYAALFAVLGTVIFLSSGVWFCRALKGLRAPPNGADTRCMTPEASSDKLP